MICNKTDGTPYCEFGVTDTRFAIRFLSGTMNGYRIYMDRQILPDLKKFLESLELDTETTTESTSEKILRAKERKGLDIRRVLENFRGPRDSSRK